MIMVCFVVVLFSPFVCFFVFVITSLLIPFCVFLCFCFHAQFMLSMIITTSTKIGAKKTLKVNFSSQ